MPTVAKAKKPVQKPGIRTPHFADEAENTSFEGLTDPRKNGKSCG